MATLLFDLTFRDDVVGRLSKLERLSLPLDGAIPAAVAVTLVGNEEGEAAFVLTRRPLRLRRHAGQWALPGGRTDRGEHPEDTAIRELQEEVGVTIDPDAVLGLLDDYRTRSGFRITPVVLWGPRSPVLQPDPGEVHVAHLVPLTALEPDDVPRITEAPGSDRPLISLHLAFLGTTIWAPTAAILYQMREVLLKGRPTRVAHFDQPRFAWK